MIIKPEDAVPTNAIHRIYEGLDGFTDQVRPMFTAAECAEIAKAYAKSFLVEELDWHKISDAPEWRAKFEEWQQ